MSSKTFSTVPAEDETSRRIPCPVCGGNSFRDRWLVGSSRFVCCSGCGLLLQNPRPFHDSLAARYDEAYFRYEKENEDSFVGLSLLGLGDAGFFETIAPTLPGPLSVLDVGCATGRLLHHFRQRGWETAGAELCRESVDYGNAEYDVNIVPAALEDAGFPSESFSAVHASHLIEHVDDPAGFVREVVRVLRPGGIFVCVTPAADGFQARLFGSSWRSLIEDHVTLFDKKNLVRLLAACGLRVERIRTWGGLGTGTAPGWIKAPVDRMAKKLGFGDVVLMTARKSAS